MPVEQAIFTSARTARGDGYQLVARSPGVSEEVARELAAWGPSHGALCEERDEATSVNFHQLASGAFCVSKTVASGQEFSGRGGARIYTHLLLVPADVLARFANNPFAVLRAAWAKGLLTIPDRLPERLESFSLVGRSAIVDEGLLAQLADRWGSTHVARLVAAALSPGVKLLAGASHMETLIGGLVNCFPVECRTAITFTTGLRYSPRRPFRMAPLDGDDSEKRRTVRHEGVTVVDLSPTATPPNHECLEAESTGWPALVAQAIATDQLPKLVAHLQLARPNLSVEQLNVLGNELLPTMRASPVSGAVASAEQAFRSARVRHSENRPDGSLSRSANPSRPIAATGPRLSVATGSSSDLHTITDPAAVELLEQLDDAVYDAVNGAPDSLDTVGKLWEALSRQLNPAALAATREQYLRYSLSLWDASHEEGLREPARASRALDVLTVLFETE